MPEQSKDETVLIDLSEVAKSENPRASSLDTERAERERRRRAENDAAAQGEKPKPFVAPPD